VLRALVDPPCRSVSRRGWVLFLTMSVIWGIPYLLIKVAVEELSPATLVFLRCGLAALVLVPLAASRGGLRAPLRHWKPLLAFTLLEMTGPWLLLAYAEQTLTSSLTGLLVATVPIVSVVAGRVVGEDDRLDPLRVAGMVVGLLGVGALLGLDIGGGEVMAVGAVALTVLGYGTAPLIISRKLGGVSSTGVSAWALLLTALVYLPLAGPRLASEGLPSGTVVGAVLTLALVCTAAALVLFFALIREVGPEPGAGDHLRQPGRGRAARGVAAERAPHDRDADRVPAGAGRVRAGHPAQPPRRRHRRAGRQSLV
jgi:drug/metabolite transporter (DMT)-like permease